MTWCNRQNGLGVSGWLASAYPGSGIQGQFIPADGEHGASPVRNDVVLPAENASEFYWRIVTPPATGVLQVFEDLSFIWTPPDADASDRFTYALYQDYLLRGTADVSLRTGQPQSTLSGAAGLGDVGAAGAILGDSTAVFTANSPDRIGLQRLGAGVAGRIGQSSSSSATSRRIG